MPIFQVDAVVDVIIDARDADAAQERFLDVFGRDDSAFCNEPAISSVSIYEIEQL